MSPTTDSTSFLGSLIIPPLGRRDPGKEIATYTDWIDIYLVESTIRLKSNRLVQFKVKQGNLLHFDAVKEIETCRSDYEYETECKYGPVRGVITTCHTNLISTDL